VWEPVGPLSAAVYWRRRAVALASALTLVGVVLATAGKPTGTPVPAADRTPTTSTAGPTGSTDAPTPATPPVRGAAPASEGTPDAGAPGSVPNSTAPAPTTHTSAPMPLPTSTVAPLPPSVPPTTSGAFSAQSVPGTTERIHPDDTVRPSVVAQPVPSSGPVPCTNAMLAAAAELDHPVHRVGSHPVLRLVITNISGQPCVRDLDSARQEIVVWSGDGTTRLWSSNDCVNASSIDLRTLVPGRPVAFAVTWGERTTTPGCRRPRTLVPAGTYRLMVRLDGLISPPTPFIRTP
jgi:hypothetical protein